MYGREETVRCLLAHKADPAAPGGPAATNSVHLAASRPTSTVLRCTVHCAAVAVSGSHL